MPKIVISGVAHAYIDDPRSDEPLCDNDVFALLHGLCSSDECSNYFDEPLLAKLGVSGGRLRFVHDPDSSAIRISTAYDVPRDLTEEERKELVGATLVQWSDGMGSGSFSNHRGDVLSTTLAMALQNSDASETELGDLFVNAYPFVDDRDIQIEYSPEGNADEDLINDIVVAAEADEESALVELGQRYENGNGVEQNAELAFEMYSRAAELGDEVGKTFYGFCLLRGFGTEQNQEKAIECFQEAAEAGFPLAIHMLGECYGEGRGVPVDEKRAFELYQQGAEVGDPGCLAEMGDCLEFGKGVEKDLNEALRYYQESLAGGFDAVQDAIDRVERELGVG